jgi:hypothetical protein
MTAYEHLFTLSSFSQPSERIPSDIARREYEGQLIFSGPDAAIEVVGGRVRGYVGGKPSHPSGQLAAMIDEHESSIIRGAEDVMLDSTAAVIFSGRWHHIDFDSDPRFEGYLVHVIDEAGNVATSRYRSEIFDWDEPDLSQGAGFPAVLSGDPSGDRDSLIGYTEKHLARFGREKYSMNGLAAFDGILWWPTVRGLPAYVSLAKASSAEERLPERNGTLLSEARLRVKAMRSTQGLFRGGTVDRSSHRPAELTLDEIIASTDAIGFWTQTWDGLSEPNSAYQLAVGDLPRGDLILRKIDASSDPHALRNVYASDWHRVHDIEKTSFRVLAVGSIPDICRDPL